MRNKFLLTRFILLLTLLSVLLCSCGKGELTSSDLSLQAATTEAISAVSSQTSAAETSGNDTSRQTSSAKETAAAQASAETIADSSLGGTSSGSSSGSTVSDPDAEHSQENTSSESGQTYETQAQAESPAAAVSTMPEASQDVPQVHTCLIIVDAGGDMGVLYSGNISFEGTASVYDILTRTGVVLTGDSSYISAINGLAEKQHGPMSGWLYTVNDVMPMVSCGGYSVNDGDYIYWYYQYDE